VTRTRHLRWRSPERTIPKHPYRDSLLLYAFLAVLVVVVAWLGGGSIVRGVVIAVAAWLAASAWSVVRWRQRLQRSTRDESLGERR